jgi:DNA polymerase-3 subunit gamma/tau
VQSLLEQAVYKPVQGRFKVFMIDEVHMLTNTAFNAMLKTLEEPPEYLKFVLATTDPQKVPVTVLSRCLQFNLRPMAPETVHEHLTQVLQPKRAGRAQALRLLARAARGSMRDALSLTDQAIAFGNGTLVEAAVRRCWQRRPRPCVPPDRRARAGRRQDRGRDLRDAAARRPIGRFHAGRDDDRAAAPWRCCRPCPPAPTCDGTDRRRRDRRAWPRRCRPMKRSCSTACACMAGRIGLAPDEYAALTMVLLRLLAFKPSAEKKTLNERGSGPVRPLDRAASPPGRRTADTPVPRSPARRLRAPHPAPTGPSPASSSRPHCGRGAQDACSAP